MKSITCRAGPTAAASLLVVSLALSGTAQETNGAAAVFDEAYRAWVQCTPELTSLSVRSSLPPGYVDGPEFDRIVSLGPPALPYIMAKIQEAEQQKAQRAVWLSIAVARIAKKQFYLATDALQWWATGREVTADQFHVLRQEWERVRSDKETVLWTAETIYYAPAAEVYTKRRKMTEAGEVYQAVEDLGLAVLPHIVAELRAGKHDFLDMAIELTDRQARVRLESLPVLPEVRAERFLNWWEASKQDWLIPWPDEPTAP
jgi:hypothetical protein